MSALQQPTWFAMPIEPSGSALDSALEQALRRVRLRARRRTAWLRNLWSEEGEPGGKYAVTHAEIDTHLDDRDAPAAEAAWYDSEPSLAPLNRSLAEVEQSLAADGVSRFSQLQRIFGLRQKESDLFQVCLAVAIDPSLSRVYAYLQDHAGRNYATEDLAARLFGHGRCGSWNPDSPLARWELVAERDLGSGEPRLLACDPLIRDWLLGRSRLDEALVSVAAFQDPLPPLRDWPIKETTALLNGWLSDERSCPIRVCLAGVPGSGRRTLAATVSARLGLPLLAMDTEQIGDAEWVKVFRRAQRQAHLNPCALAWHGAGALGRLWPRVLPWFPLQFVIAEEHETLPAVPGVTEHRIAMPTLSLRGRCRLWRRLVPVSARWPRQALGELVERHSVTVGDLTAMARKGIAHADEAAALIRESGRQRLGNLAQRLECTFTWADLVVSDHLRAVLEDMVFEARERAAFWEQPKARRLFPQGRGLIGLFSGPPGTGKTMAAQVMAAELGLDLFRIDLSAVVSKYVGETSQNLERILARAARMDAVLLFDEADALFGKRTEIRDAHDRFANTDTGYLLQAIESYPGIALLATNQKSNIDPAFIRRLRYVLEFPKPDVGQRQQIWQRLIGELAGPQRLVALAKDLDVLAERVETTGAQIKFAVLPALFAAKHAGKPLAMPHLLRGLERELMKEGRGLSDRERERLQNHG